MKHGREDTPQASVRTSRQRPGEDRATAGRAAASPPPAKRPSPASPQPDAQPAQESPPDPAMLFECAWEVCNKLGGIYQVLRSKCAAMVRAWGDRYTVIGPWEPEQAALEFSETEPDDAFRAVIDSLAAEGIVVHHGRWLVDGRPRALLIEHWRGAEHLDRVKYRLWDHHRIPSPVGDPMLDGVISFSDAVRRLIERLAECMPDRRVLLHGHEWMGGLAIPMLRHDNVRCGLTFTTHATLLGRYIASGDEHFYEHLPHIDDGAQAETFDIKTQHRMERSCAHAAHVLTTVSPITAEECTHLLGRTPDVITPNGLNMARFDVGHEFQTLHAKYKEKIHRFTMGHFFPSYSFDLTKTIYAFSSGRYEPRNKGFDLCLEAMARLNAELKAAKSDVTVVFFIISRRATRSLNPKVLERRGVMFELKDVCDNISEQIAHQLFPAAASGKKLSVEGMIDDYWQMRYKRTQQAFNSHELPYISTHVIDNDHKDPVLNHIRQLGLFNRAEDPVKVVYHPDFISPASPLWGIDYEQFVRGCHVGVFPSAYEPWGYTPLECVAMGVPAMTSDLAGFGRYVKSHLPDHDEWGMSVVGRRGRSFFDAAAELTQQLLRFCELDRRGRISLRNAVEERSEQFDWSQLVGAYDKAHELTLSRIAAGAG